MFRSMMAFPAVAALMAAISVHAAPPPPAVDAAWVRLSVVPGRPAAAYFTLKGGAKV